MGFNSDGPRDRERKARNYTSVSQIPNMKNDLVPLVAFDHIAGISCRNASAPIRRTAAQDRLHVRFRQNAHRIRRRMLLPVIKTA